ncbi:MAG: DUF1572 family protein [Puia sp.]|nr:DUF1572 family protein [Puia sp.]
MTTGSCYLQSAIDRFTGYKTLAEKAMSQLEEKDFHFQPAEGSNSIAIIIQHMAGNMLSRWTHFLTEDGEKDWRDRDAEFDQKPVSYQHLMELWEKGWNCMLDTLRSLTEEDLLKTVYIRSEPNTVIDAINRQLAHYPYHAGQILYLAKMVRGPEWKSLSIPRGQSGDFNKTMKKRD